MTPTTREAVERKRLLDFIGASIESLSCGNWQSNCICGRCNERRELQLDYDALAAEVEGLRRALDKYGRHDSMCDFYRMASIAEKVCDCGLSAALAPSCGEHSPACASVRFGQNECDCGVIP